MIKQSFPVEYYWKVVVFYNVDYGLFHTISEVLLDSGADVQLVGEIYDKMSQNKAKAVTYSNLGKHISIVLFNRHSNKADYINSVVHEAEHIKQAMLKAYRIEDKGEPPAYTIGYLVMRMYKVFKHLISS